MPVRDLPGSPNFNEIPGQPLRVDTPPPKAEMSSAPPAGTHGAQAPKPTSVRAMSPQGAAVNPDHRNGGVTDPMKPYPAHATEWAVESGTHA